MAFHPGNARRAVRVLPFAALVVAAAVILSGCSSRTSSGSSSMTRSGSSSLVPVDTATSEATNATPVRPSAATMNLSRDPVDIQDGGDVGQGVSKDWSWHVAPGYTAFTVEVDMAGPQGAPAYTATGLGWRLTGGDPSKTAAEQPASQTSSQTSNSGCVLCYDGSAKDNQPGQWSLHFEAGPSAASWSVHVHVAY